jgi:hypothetical protein
VIASDLSSVVGINEPLGKRLKMMLLNLLNTSNLIHTSVEKYLGRSKVDSGLMFRLVARKVS